MELKDIPPWLSAVGIGLTVVQIWLVRRQHRVTFEDKLGSEYRDIVSELPAPTLLGEELTPEQIEADLHVFIRYFDLCNEQAFLRSLGRVSRDTWMNWRSGILANLRRPAFAEAWRHVSSHEDHGFTELAQVISEGAACDPRRW